MNEQIPNVGLRLAALAAGIPIVWLSKEFSPRPLDVFLTLIFYAGPNIVIAICSRNWQRLQVGVGIGYPLSMIAALQLYQHARSGAFMFTPGMPPVPPPSVAAYNAALFFEVILLLSSIAVLIWRRKHMGDWFGVTLSFVGGFVYPFLAFVTIAVIDQL